MTDVFDAIRDDDLERVRALVADEPQTGKQRDPEGVSALLTALYYGREAIAQELARHATDLDVFEAAAYGDADRLASLLDADPSGATAWSPDGFQPLGLAVFFGHLEAARLLIDRGAKVDEPARHAQIKAAPIHSATAAAEPAARYALTELLLDHGANVNAAQEGGFTPLHAAAQHGDFDLARLLLERGADGSLQTDEGLTAAEIARAQDQVELGELLEA
jgi:ankyrin repeat protein